MWVVNPDGSGLRRLNTLECINDACDVAEGSLVLSPWEWSPDGTRLACYGYAYHRDEGGADHAIYLLSADGSEVTDLTSDLPELEDTSQLNPHWSPDSTRLALDNDDGLYVVNADGSGSGRSLGAGFRHGRPTGRGSPSSPGVGAASARSGSRTPTARGRRLSPSERGRWISRPGRPTDQR